jgi:hypothetical protein
MTTSVYVSVHYAESLYWLSKRQFVAMQISGTELTQTMEAGGPA